MDQSSPTRAAGDLTGARLGRFRIVEHLGAGAMGVVYRGLDERLQREVAIKVLPSGILADRSVRERFRNEALALSRLNHPNIAIIYDFDTQAGIDFLVMELVPGETLDRQRERGPLAENELRNLGVQLAEALATAHARGVIHRDLKPANLKVTPEGRLKVLDFGVAALVRPAATASASLATLDISTAEFQQALVASLQTPNIVGTLPYIAPEVLQGAPVDGRADVYSAGVLLYELCCGRLPFMHPDVRELVSAILHQPPPPFARDSTVGRGFQNVVLKALEKDPLRRYQTARELLDVLHSPEPPRHPRRGGAIDSIAVLPFENVGANPESEYLSEGVTEHLIRSLSELPQLKKVIARGSVYRYKGREVTPEQVGRELGVRAVLIGRVTQHGDNVAISAELADTSDERHLWGESYQRHLDSLDQVEHEIVSDISEKLRLKLARTTKHATPSEAYRLYLKGRFYWNKRPAAGMVQKAIELFEQATEIDPKFALAYAGLADCYNTMGAWESSAMAPQLAFPQAKTVAARALRLDDSLAEAHTAVAYTALHYDWNCPQAEVGFRRAFELNQNYVHAHHWYAHCLVAAGRFDEALAESLRIIELDPLDLVTNVHLAWHYCMAHQFEQAAVAATKTLDLEPNFHWGHFFLGWAYEQLGRHPHAVEALEKSTALSGGSTVMKAALGHAYASAGFPDRARQVLAELREQSHTRYVSSYEMSLIHAALGEIDTACSLLERAFEERSGWLPYIEAEPRLGSLRDDPRFQRLLGRVESLKRGQSAGE